MSAKSTFSAGPVIEQGTHFCDLSRYFGGDVDISSVVAHSLEWDEEPGKLRKIAFDEASVIKPEDRIPRVTSATWYGYNSVNYVEHGFNLP
jgi:predicted dehydrogenase